jgi:hypothetical protein
LGVARLQNGLAPLQNAFTALQNGLAPLQNAFAALFLVLAVVRGAIARLFRRLDGLCGLGDGELGVGLDGVAQCEESLWLSIAFRRMMSGAKSSGEKK